jgi:transcriptional regulator with XRE-family HTH domain
MQPSELGRNLRQLRRKSGKGLRELSRSAGMSAAALSAVEKGTSSPTLATLHKILKALGTTFSEFFAPPDLQTDAPVFPAAGMKVVEDAHRQYVVLMPRRPDIRFEMILENLAATEREPEWESHDCDMGGVLLSGGPMRLEIDGAGEWNLTKGTAFYVKSGLRHRATNLGRQPIRLLTVWHPPRY